MLYHLLEKQMEDDTAAGYHTAKYLDYLYIDKAVHGFFDKPDTVITTGDFYTWQHTKSAYVNTATGTFNAANVVPNSRFANVRQPGDSLVNAKEYAMPIGASFSAYIFGNDNRLVAANLNKGTSIYPETIGYNVNSASSSPTNTADPLYSTRMPIYGQVAKTPEWAEMVTGVKADDIRAFAEMFAEKNLRGEKVRVGMFTGWGSNRTNEPAVKDQPGWLLRFLPARTVKEDQLCEAGGLRGGQACNTHFILTRQGAPSARHAQWPVKTGTTLSRA